MKYCAVEDSVDMPPLLPWLPMLRCSYQSIDKSVPTAEQLADPENIFSLVWKTNRSMVELGLADATVRHYREEGLVVILKRHYEARAERFSEDILDQMIIIMSGDKHPEPLTNICEKPPIGCGKCILQAASLWERSQIGDSANLLSRFEHF